MIKRQLYILTILVLPMLLPAQTKTRIFGYVIDKDNRSIENVSVSIESQQIFTRTNKNGFYELNVPIKDSAIIVYSHIGYKPIRHSIYSGTKIAQISVEMQFADKTIKEVNITSSARQTGTLNSVDLSKFRLMPNANGSIESMLITFAGVSSTNELSSQYNVRGGNFDENAVYVNGIEVYRPLLIRAGQQEGLSFVNQDMVKNLNFSSGGFDARFGDKMSSVLDIEYKRPTEFESKVSLSLLGASAYVGTASNKFTQMHGIRYKTSKYLLGTLDTKAEYKPSFVDYQTYMTYQLSPKMELTFLGNFSQNIYQFVPQSRSTTFGTYNIGRNFSVYFEGQESDLFRTAFGALTLNYKPKNNLKLSFLASVFNTSESESYDIDGQYILNEVKIDMSGSSKKGAVLGIGTFQQHARNQLNATVSNVSHLGEWDITNHRIKWGATLQQEQINDKIGEWERRDSSGFSLPFNPSALKMFYALKSDTSVSSIRGVLFFQDTYRFALENGYLSLTGGLRGNYWSFNKELLVSPRLSATFVPAWKREFSFRIATGMYYQAPFYKEFRSIVSDASNNYVVKLNNQIKAQRSLQVVLGGDYHFRMLGRPFKFSTEAYLKLADRIISYTVDNVRIRYSGYNNAKAYTTGIDFKLNGELVPGAESWINLSLMDSKEDVSNDSYIKKTYDADGKLTSSTTVYPTWLERPNAQRYVFSMVFQDYLPNNPKYKMNLVMIWSDGLPITPPLNSSNASAFRSSGVRAPAYRRVDIGASRILANGSDKLLDKKWFKHIKSIWLNLEVLNLLDFNNVNSYYWVSDVSNNQWAVPNYLTGRQLNLKILVDFK